MNNKYYEQLITDINELIAKGYYHQARKKIILELDLPYVPEPYNKMLEALNDTVATHLKEMEPPSVVTAWDLAAIKKVLASPFDEEIHPVAFYYLQNLNARLIMTEIKHYLNSDLFNDTNKTLLLLVLRDQGVDEPLSVRKSFNTFKINPQMIPNLDRLSWYQQVHQRLKDTVGNDNPGLYKLCSLIAESYFYERYPEAATVKDLDAFIAALVYKAETMQDIKHNLPELVKIYHTTEPKLMGWVKLLNQLQIN